MMHCNIHSALAIKRQRKRRDDQKRARERRYSLQSTESGENHSPHGSTRRKHRSNYGRPNNVDSKVVTSIGMLHIGVVFVVFGIFLIGAGVIPDDVTTQNAWSIFAKDSWWNELVLTGLFAMGLGIFLIVLNGIISKNEDDELEAYVQSQLTRSRSGHRLERDVETGGLQTRQTKRENQIRKECEERGLDDTSDNLKLTPTSSEFPITSSILPSASVGCSSGEMLLERIQEEDSSCADDSRHSGSLNNDETHLLTNGSIYPYSTRSVHVTNI